MMIVILMSFTCSHNDESNLMSFCSHNGDSNLMSFTSLHCLSSGIPHLAVAQPHRRREWMCCCAGKASGIERRGYLHQCSQSAHTCSCDVLWWNWGGGGGGQHGSVLSECWVCYWCAWLWACCLSICWLDFQASLWIVRHKYLRYGCRRKMSERCSLLSRRCRSTLACRYGSLVLCQCVYVRVYIWWKMPAVCKHAKECFHRGC